MKVCKIALLGAGTVGGGIIKLLEQNGDTIQRIHGIKIEIAAVLVNNINKKREGVDPALLTDDFSRIIEDDEICLVAEAAGGINPMRDYALASLNAGKTYVTANKELIAKCWPELEAAAEKTGAGLYFEPAVAGAVPVIKALTDSLQANHMTSVMGIINGTTNYILSKMADEGWDYGDALKTAQALGYAEPDPTNDVEGFDTAFKLAILASLAFNKRVELDDIFRTGISAVTAEDVEIARELGYAIKLLAVGKSNGEEIEARVHPTMVPLSHPLATVSGPFNAVFVEGSASGPLMFYGRGAGDLPTASAQVSDIINALTETSHKRYAFALAENGTANVSRNWETAYYIRTMAADRPGVLEKVAGVFAKHNVSIESVVQRGRGTDAVPLVFVTHKAHEKAVMAAIEDIKTMDFLSVASIIRVEN